jgi:anti-sigma regulatory factor (Ser/Thr protein kinase)
VATGSKRPGQRFERSYPQDDRNAPRRARSAIAELPGIDDRTRRDLTIVVSELVANAVRHAPRVEGSRVVLRVVTEPEVVRVEVSDPGDGFEPVADPAAEGGLGLVIVGRLALEWGVVADDGTTVWCELPIDG